MRGNFSAIYLAQPQGDMDVFALARSVLQYSSLKHEVNEMTSTIRDFSCSYSDDIDYTVCSL